jgi:hypothetical protein
MNHTCACSSYSLPEKKYSFEEKNKPAEWSQLVRERHESQFHKDYGYLTYRCDVCGRLIKFMWVEHEDESIYELLSID